MPFVANLKSRLASYLSDYDARRIDLSVIGSFQDTVDRMRATRDIKERVVIAGLMRKPVEDDGITKACDNCIYFLARRAWCDLPELNIPVDPDWFCDLWRV